MTPEQQLSALQKRLDEIAEICRAYNHPGCNLDTHRITNKILQLADAETKREFQ